MMALFFALAYLLSWWPGLIAAGGLSPVGPLLAAIIVIWLVGGKTALKVWWKQAARWRGSPRWYLLAILLPFTINFTAAVLTVLFGAPFPDAEKIARWPELFIIFPLYLVAFGPLGEEPGWRGLAMPRFQRNHSALVASLILGLFVAVWHLPLVMNGQQHAIILIAVVASQIMYTWLAHQVEGSILIVMVAHAAQGGLGGEYFGTMFTGADAFLETSFLVAIQSLVAIAIIFFNGSALSRRQPGTAAADTPSH
jgi:membrane protease YdiL (CAAX protease family)